jgi:hypothetical protein
MAILRQGLAVYRILLVASGQVSWQQSNLRFQVTLNSVAGSSLLLLLVASCVFLMPPARSAAQDEHRSNGKDGPVPDAKVAEVIKILDSIPGWPMIAFDRNEESLNRANADAQKIEASMEKIAQFDSSVIRVAISQYEADFDKSRRPETDSERLLFLNRFLFKIPETVRRDSPHFSHIGGGGWIPMPPRRLITGIAPSDVRFARWPWLEEKDGTYRFEVHLFGLKYNGPPYPALEIFDYCEKEFGRREIVRKTTE